MHEPGPCWVDGQLVNRGAAALLPTDSAFASGRGCYTTARLRAGRIRFAGRHAARLTRDALRLGIGVVAPARVIEGLEASGRAAFGKGGDGIVRIQASRDDSGVLHLTAVPRHPGHEPVAWSACLSLLVHEGPMPWSGAKVSNHLLFALALDQARQRDVDEVFLADRDGYAIEGARSNLIVVGEDGVLSTPDLSRGGVAGVGLEVLRERAPEIRERHIPKGELFAAPELLAVNSIRGPRPVVRLDDQRIGLGRPGPVAQRLQSLFDED
jgi:branched-subunit amino acid aminotransferase/4-amino-4-deoxychorismate lyase